MLTVYLSWWCCCRPKTVKNGLSYDTSRTLFACYTLVCQPAEQRRWRRCCRLRRKGIYAAELFWLKTNGSCCKAPTSTVSTMLSIDSEHAAGTTRGNGHDVSFPRIASIHVQCERSPREACSWILPVLSFLGAGAAFLLQKNHNNHTRELFFEHIFTAGDRLATVWARQ